MKAEFDKRCSFFTGTILSPPSSRRYGSIGRFQFNNLIVVSCLLDAHNLTKKEEEEEKMSTTSPSFSWVWREFDQDRPLHQSDQFLVEI